MKESNLFKIAINSKVINKDKIKNNILSTSSVSNRVSFFARKKASAFILAIIVLMGVFVPMASVYSSYQSLNATPEMVESYNELYGVINKFNVIERENNFNVDEFLSDLKGLFEGNFFERGMAADNITVISEQIDFSKTNIQTEGLDEGDIVKTDGHYIYKLNDKGFFIIGASSGQLEIVSSIIIDNYVPKEMYICGNKLVLIGGINETYFSNYVSVQPLFDYYAYAKYNKTDIRIYDITQKDLPVLNRQITVDGNLNTSRLKLEDGKLLYTVNYRFYSNVESTYVPKIKDTAINEGEETFIPAEYIYFYDDVVSYYYLIVGEIDLNEPEVSSKLGAFLGLGGTIYVSAENIYVATYDYQSIYKKNALGWVSDNGIVGSTRIVKISLETLTQTASGRVDGRIDNRYWMDEYGGHLRVATIISARDRENYSGVFVLDSNLNVVGKIENIAPGESIYSVRFNGITGSLVTFKQVDPYFNLDLSNPTNPLISDGLKEDGVSHYIHYIGDTTYTIGVGRMSEVVQSSWGERVVWTGLKVSLYDNSSGEAVNINTIVLEGQCYAELFYNPKALLYDEERGLFAFAYENWQGSGSWFYSSMQQGLAVFNFDLTKEDAEKLTYKGTLTNLGNEISPYNNDYTRNYWSFINRGIRIGDYIYTISNQFIKSYSLFTLEQIEALDLYQIIE